jgi:signal transduction histidine kinase
MEEKTFFAPALRSSIQEILSDNELIASQKLFGDIFGAMNGIGAVIDNNRQIVYANNEFFDLLGDKTVESVLGKRPGEVISCIHSEEEPSGCGTSNACRYCGVVNAILASQITQQKSSRETKISSEVNGRKLSWDLNVTSTPINLAGHLFYVLILQDISSQRRIESLERIFFHDLLNSAGGLYGLLTLLKEGTAPGEELHLIDLSVQASQDIIEEITAQKQIRMAEAGDLQVNIEPVNSIEFVNSSIEKIKQHEVGKGKHIMISEDVSDVDFETDKSLLQRVILNMLKNALEASHQNGTVKVGVDKIAGNIRFWVKNDTVIPLDVQMQLSQRSYSTKGSGRGLGTYSMKLLTENYLKGKVSFTSNEFDGTVFTVELDTKFPGKSADLG